MGPFAGEHAKDPTRLNPGLPLDLGWVSSVKVNRPGIEGRAAEIGTRRSVKKHWQAAWLLKAVTMIDLTTLAGDDTPGKVNRLCAKARMPVRHSTLRGLGLDEDLFASVKCGAVCVYPSRVADAVKALDGSGIPVASVATGFPSGQIPHDLKLEEIKRAVGEGAREIDIVINRDAALRGDWQRVYDEVVDMRAACGDAHLKAILATGELGTYRTVYQASLVCMMAGSDFIKTSTGKEKTNANLEVSLVMIRALREYQDMVDAIADAEGPGRAGAGRRASFNVGFKPAGGIATAKQAVTFLSLMKDELGDGYLNNHMFRFGASSLLTDIERQLLHQAEGSYAALHYMPMA